MNPIDSVIALITARGGSKGVPHKNVRPLGGHPLITYSIEAAKKCAAIEAIYVTTDDAEIKKIAASNGAQVIDRPVELAQDQSRSEDVIEHAIAVIKKSGHTPKYFVLLQPTSPLRTARHLDEAIDLLKKNPDAPGVISLTDAEHHPYKTLLKNSEGALEPCRDLAALSTPRQYLPKAYRQNGAIYLLNTEDFLTRKSFYFAGVLPYFMDSQSSLDIDSLEDFTIAEMRLRGHS
jgi:CMP-N,N'-diacetyllegionaminic acid synthase